MKLLSMDQVTYADNQIKHNNPEHICIIPIIKEFFNEVNTWNRVNVRM